MKIFNKRIVLSVCFLIGIQLFGQEAKIENYKRWKYVSELLTAMQDSGAVFLRLQDFENSKNYVRRNYEKSTYNLYLDKLEEYNEVLERDIARGFTFCKVYIFNSKLSKYVLNDKIEQIEFLDPKTGNITHISKDTPHIFAEIKDLKLSGNTNPLNFSSQRLIRILDRTLQKDEAVDLQQDFFYHSNLKGKERCPHVFEAAQKLSHNFDELLVTSEKKKKRLMRQIKSKHEFRIKDYRKKIDTMVKVKEGKITDQHRTRLNKEITKYRSLIQGIKRLENELFD